MMNACFLDRQSLLWLVKLIPLHQKRRLQRIYTFFAWVMVNIFFRLVLCYGFWALIFHCYITSYWFFMVTLGNAEGLGNIRKEEFFKSCQLLGLHESNIIIHEYYQSAQIFRIYFLIPISLFRRNPCFVDSQAHKWDPKAVADTTYFYIQKYKINNVGISKFYSCHPKK